MPDTSLSSSVKYLPVYSLKKTFKYIQNINDGRKLFKSYINLIMIWAGAIFGGLFPFVIWENSVKYASHFFYVDPNWFIAVCVVLCSISLFSNGFYIVSKTCFYAFNYYHFGNMHSVFRPITESQIKRISNARITINDLHIVLQRPQILTIHSELLTALKNKREKHKIKAAYEKFMHSDIIGAMIESPFVAHTIASTFDTTNDTTARAIRHKYTALSMVTDLVNNPEECSLEGRLMRMGKHIREMQEELTELLELAQQNDVMSIDSGSGRSSIELTHIDNNV